MKTLITALALGSLLSFQPVFAQDHAAAPAKAEKKCDCGEKCECKDCKEHGDCKDGHCKMKHKKKDHKKMDHEEKKAE